MTTITIPIKLDLSQETKDFLSALRTLERTTHTCEPTKANSSTPPAHGEHWAGQGGHYICTLPALLGLPARHLIAGPECDDKLKYGQLIDVPGASSHIDGRANTAALLACGQDHQAANWAAQCTEDGHSDFFLPAKLDLVMAHICAPKLFKNGWYWSSTQTSCDGAFVQGFENGGSDWGYKVNQLMVRAFRWIPLERLAP